MNAEPPAEHSPVSPSCPACGLAVGARASFCAACGAALDPGRARGSLPAERATRAWRRVLLAAMCYLGLLGVVGFATIAGDAIDVRGYLVVDAAFAAIVLAFAVVFRRAIVPLLRLPRMDAHSWILMVAGPAVVWLVNRAVILAISGIPQAFVSDPAVELRAAGASTATVLFFLCVTPPIFEEIAFRGILLEAMRESFGARSAAVVVAVLFSILHVAILSFVPLAGLGVLLAVLRLRSASLWPAVVAHALYNLPGAVWT